MKLSSKFVFLALTANLAYSAPAPNPGNIDLNGILGRIFGQGGGFGGGRHHGGGGKGNGQGQSNAANNTGNANNANAAGATFFISNDPSGNAVIVNTINTDGTLSFATAVPTGGLGAHGVTDPNGPDALFSQGAVKVLGSMLFAVNAGSNTISMFTIDLKNPDILTMVGAPIGSGGEFPVSLAVSEKNNMVCALNGGEVNGVACFKASPDAGLVPVSNSVRDLKVNQTTPANGPAGTMSHVIFSEDGKQLFAAVKGVPPTPGFIASFDVADDGSLSQDFASSTPASGGLLPFGMTNIPGTKAVLSTDAAVGYTIFDFSKGNNATNAVFPIEGQGAVCWVVHSQKTGNFYLSDLDKSIVTEVNVDKNLNSTIVAQYPQGDGTGSIDDDIATINGNDFLYVLLSNATTISVSSLDAPGKAKQIEKFNVADEMKKAGVDLPVNPFNVMGMTVFVPGGASGAGSVNASASNQNQTQGQDQSQNQQSQNQTQSQNQNQNQDSNKGDSGKNTKQSKRSFRLRGMRY